MSKPRTLPRVAAAFLAHVAAVGATPPAEIPERVRPVLLELGLVVQGDAPLLNFRLSDLGARAVLGWRESQGAELAGKALWLIEHLREGHVEIGSGLAVLVKDYPFRSTEHRVAVERWRQVRARVVGAHFREGVPEIGG